MTAGEAEGHLISMRSFVVEWGQCDPAGIVFHPRYFEIFDACAAQLFTDASGMTKAEMLRRHGAAGIPVVEAGANFHHPCRYGDAVCVETWIAGIGRSSFKLRHRLKVLERLAVEGWSTRVWTVQEPGNPGQLRSRPMPTELAARLRGDTRAACPAHRPASEAAGAKPTHASGAKP